MRYILYLRPKCANDEQLVENSIYSYRLGVILFLILQTINYIIVRIGKVYGWK